MSVPNTKYRRLTACLMKDVKGGTTVVFGEYGLQATTGASN